MERKEHTMRLHNITKSESDENLNTLINCDICQNLSCEISLKKKIKKKSLQQNKIMLSKLYTIILHKSFLIFMLAKQVSSV